MWSESEIQNLKKIALDEVGRFLQNNEAEKAFDEAIEKARNLDFSGLHYDKESFDYICEKSEICPDMAAYFKDNLSYDLDLTGEEKFRNVMRLAKEYLVKKFVSKECLRKEEELSLKIFTDQEYAETVETDLHDKIKKIILKHGPFTGPEIDDFVRENLNRPVLEEIFNDFKGNEDIRNAMKKYGVATVHPIMPHLIYLEFFAVNENLIEEM